ncbi:hypothetical protein F5887DRAFT_114819 [Amanita rubescens]|nr:hypothetical protein F5887DRAFT_114819 [Amanita rubescens]
MASPSPHQDRQRKLVIAFDVGTNFSSVSYSTLGPGMRPDICGVNRFPGQIQGKSEIPSVLYYDVKGVVQAIGAEAVQEYMDEIANDSGWKKVSLFKRHLSPNANKLAFVNNAIAPLPDGVTAVDIFADLLRYLYRCTKMYFEESHASGDSSWASLEKSSDFVLTYPNDWGRFQRNQLKRAAVKAGLVSDMRTASSRISFVTEGEAVLDYCIWSGLSSEALKDGKGVIVVDAGCETIEISAYARSSSSDNAFKEIVAPQRHAKGSIFVTLNAESFLKDHLRDSDFSGDEEIKRMIKQLDKYILSFRSSEDDQFIKFGSLRDNDPSKGIHSGQLRLAGSDVARFFTPSLQCICETILEMKDNSKIPIASMLFVGSFSKSDYLYNQIDEAIRHHGIDVFRPLEHGQLNKAIVSGAISSRQLKTWGKVGA